MSTKHIDLNEIRKELSIKGKNGIAFIIAGTIVWSIITIIFFLPLDIYQKNIFMLFTTGIMFPLSIAVSTIIKADWKFENNPFSNLATYLNLAQIMYFPILFWAIANSPNEAVLFFAIIVGAHFYPFGWFYNVKAFYFMAPIIAIVVTLVGCITKLQQLWLIPLTMLILLIVLISLLYKDYLHKSK